jgi:hypothetical protein
VSDLTELIERNDPDPLLREIDSRCNRHDWDGVLEIRTRCNAATERGKTLWGVAEHAAYRIALEAPAEYVGAVIATNTGPLALGPLPEVAASTHTWQDLAPYIEEGPLRGITAYECVAFGEDLTHDSSLSTHQAAFELPLCLQPWEPEYAKPEYLEDEARFPAPELQGISQKTLSANVDAVPLDEPQTLEAWRNLVSPWLAQSNGTIELSIVEGGIDRAILDVDARARTASQLSTEQALQWMCWAAASGGAHGRRRGIATGRNTTWLALAEACGLITDGELPHPNELGSNVAALHWWTWDDLDHTTGWQLRLAVHDPIDGVTLAVNADDHA